MKNNKEKRNNLALSQSRIQMDMFLGLPVKKWKEREKRRRRRRKRKKEMKKGKKKKEEKQVRIPAKIPSSHVHTCTHTETHPLSQGRNGLLFCGERVDQFAQRLQLLDLDQLELLHKEDKVLNRRPVGKG